MDRSSDDIWSRAVPPTDGPPDPPAVTGPGPATEGRDRGLTLFDGSAQSSSPVRLPGPGLAEAVFWTFAVVFVHVFGSAVAATIIVIGELGGSGASTPDGWLQRLGTPDAATLLIAGEMLVFVLFAIAAAITRYGRQTGRVLGWAPLSVRQALLIAALSLPLSFACGRFHHWCLAAWKALGRHVPLLWQLEQFETMDAIRQFSETTPWPALLLLLAAAPALGEELMFRGVIGTGLVARRGIVGGVLLTSLLFAGVHMHPAHAVALIPLAVFLHLVYLATHSLWAPIWLHFLNNAIAVSVLKTSEVGLGGDSTAGADWPLAVTGLAVLSSLALGRLIWQTRVRFFLPDGTVWSSGYVSAERPPRRLQATVQPGRPEPKTATVALLTLTAFLVLAATSLVV